MSLPTCSLLPVLLLFTLVHGVVINLDETTAITNCRFNLPCLFSSTAIWVGGVAPTSGDDANMTTNGNEAIYINLVAEISLNYVWVSGNIMLLIDTENKVQVGELYADNGANLMAHDVTFVLENATFSNADFTLSGKANVSVVNFSNAMSNLQLVDETTLQGYSFDLGAISTNDSSTFIGWRVVLNGDSDGEHSFSGNTFITTLVVLSYMTNFYGGNLGNVIVMNSATIQVSDNITITTLTVGNNCAFFVGMASLVLSGPAPGYISGQGNVYVTDSEVVVGNSSFTTDLQDVVAFSFYGSNTATFNNVMLANIQTYQIAGAPEDNIFFFNGVILVDDVQLNATIISTGMIISQINANIAGNITSYGDLTIVNPGKLSASTYTQMGGSMELFGPLSASTVFIFNSDIDMQSSIHGDTHLGNTTLQYSASQVAHLDLYGHLSLNSSSINLTSSNSLTVIGKLESFGQSFISGVIASATFNMDDGQLLFQGVLTTSTAIVRRSVFTIQNQSTLNCDTSFDNSTVNAVFPLFINGHLLIDSCKLSANNNPKYIQGASIQVNGSMYSMGNSSMVNPITIYASSYTHTGGFPYLQGTIMAPTISFVDTNLTIAGLTTLLGNVSLVSASTYMSGQLIIQGMLSLHHGQFLSTTPQNVQVSGQITSTGVTFINGTTVSFTTPNFLQSSSSFVLEGYLGASLLTITNSAEFTITAGSSINGNVAITGATVGVHASTNVSGYFLLDSKSQLMVYNSQPNNYATIHVAGDLTLDGYFVYWLTNKPPKDKQTVYTLFTYSGKLKGTFSSYDSYTTNYELLEFDLQYGDKEVVLVYNPNQPVNPGLVVGIVVAVAVVIIAAVFGVLYYRKYNARKDYTPIIKAIE